METLIFDIEKFAVHDGPGIRTVIFMKGCPLRCIWCHNPESQSFSPEILYAAKKCIGCGRCAEACSHNCHSISGGQHNFDRSKCVACGKCASSCHSEALELVGKPMSVDELIIYINKKADKKRKKPPIMVALIII